MVSLRAQYPWLSTRRAAMTIVVRAVSRAGGKLQAREIGEFMNFNEAVKVARQHIDDFLYREFKQAVWQGITPAKLYEIYKSSGEIMLVQPKIQKETVVMKFDALEYAAKRCADICTHLPPPAAPPPQAKT
jgi:hypothetical protein